MKLLTKAIERRLMAAPLGSTDGGSVATVIVKFFTPDGNYTWYVTEGARLDNGDWEFFGKVDGQHTEWGYFLLSQLQAIRGRFNLPVERDRNFKGTIDK